MVSENEQDKPDEKEKVCQSCTHWNLMGAHPNGNLAFGACCNNVHEDAPYGGMMAHFGSCPGYEEKIETRIQVPTKSLNRMIRKR